MKTFEIYIVDKDGYGGAIKLRTHTKAEAMKSARLYIKQWGLSPAKIEYCKEVKDDLR